MKRAYSADPIILAELAAVLRDIAKQRRCAGRLLRGMANAYEARAVALTPGAAVPHPHY